MACLFFTQLYILKKTLAQLAQTDRACWAIGRPKILNGAPFPTRQWWGRTRAVASSVQHLRALPLVKQGDTPFPQVASIWETLRTGAPAGVVGEGQEGMQVSLAAGKRETSNAADKGGCGPQGPSP